MMALKELGLRRLLKYFVFVFWEIIFHALKFSPLRICWLRIFGATIGKETIIGNLHFMNLYRQGLAGLKVGNKCFLGDRVVLDLADEIIIGNGVTISEESFLLTHTNVGFSDHPLQNYILKKSKKIIIKNGSFLGIRTVVLSGVTINEKVGVGACSLVLRDLDQNSLYVGIPVRKIKNFQNQQEL